MCRRYRFKRCGRKPHVDKLRLCQTNINEFEFGIDILDLKSNEKFVILAKDNGLYIQNPNEMMSRVDEDEKLKCLLSTSGQSREMCFLAKDVANWIEHNQVTRMIELVDEDEKIKVRPKQSLGLLTNNNEYWFLTEDGAIR